MFLPDDENQPPLENLMLTPDIILNMISHHFAVHIEAVHILAEQNKDLSFLEQKHAQFKEHINTYVDVYITYVNNIGGIEAPALETGLWSVSVMCADEPSFPDFIGKLPHRWVKLMVGQHDTIYTALYSIDGYEEEQPCTTNGF